MTQVMIAHLWQPMTLQSALKTPRKAIGTIGYTIGILEDIIVVMVAGPKPVLVVLLLIF